jgi:hypothetical protein
MARARLACSSRSPIPTDTRFSSARRTNKLVRGRWFVVGGLHHSPQATDDRPPSITRHSPLTHHEPRTTNHEPTQCLTCQIVSVY